MARRLKVKWDGGEAVDALLEVPKPGGRIGVLLAHGAGAGQRHRFMEQVRKGFASLGVTAMTFDYSYVQAGRKAPDRMPKLLAVHKAAADRLATYVDGVVLGGKSMGGRVGSHLAGDEKWPAAGMLYLGYPLVPLRTGEPRPTDHLERIAAPQLFFAGTRDRMSPPDLIASLVKKLPAAALNVVEFGDHSFKVPKKSGKATRDVIDGIVADAAQWVQSL
ncbi:MAG: dienelactone hydrolase [Acidimicrobiia bacterium]|nr:dienelactone hydrolase [Acidimicrobiia bacterium]